MSRIKEINASIAALEEEKLRLQHSCEHKKVLKKNGASTGNYDPHEDCYWVDFHCLDCGKRWTEELV
jgi:hypothetical protein